MVPLSNYSCKRDDFHASSEFPYKLYRFHVTAERLPPHILSRIHVASIALSSFLVTTRSSLSLWQKKSTPTFSMPSWWSSLQLVKSRLPLIFLLPNNQIWCVTSLLLNSLLVTAQRQQPSGYTGDAMNSVFLQPASCNQHLATSIWHRTGLLSSNN